MSAPRTPRSAWYSRRWARLIALQPPVTLVIGAEPALVLRDLTAAVRPSTDRLHLRDLFVDGRRYYLQSAVAADGLRFRLTSDTRTPGRGRRRGQRAAVVHGTISGAAQSSPAVIHLHARMFALHGLRAALFPLLLASIVIGVGWWPVGVRVGVIGFVALVSWLAHRADAALQAAAMIQFVHKALEHLPPPDQPALENARPDVIDPAAQAFSTAWERFYQQQQERGSTP